MNKQSAVPLAIESHLARLKARMPEVPTDGVFLSRLLIHLGRETTALLHKQIRTADLSEGEFRVLTSLFAMLDGVAHPSELCDATAQSPANMSRISDELVGRGLITRVPCEQDRRRMVLKITATGESLSRHLLPSLFKPLRVICGDFSERELKQLIRCLKKITARMGELR